MSSSRSVHGQTARVIHTGAVPGVELLVVQGDPQATGAVCLENGGQVLTGSDGFRQIAGLAGTDPVGLALLSSLLLEGPGVAGKAVHLDGVPGGPATLPGPPQLSGRSLTYWRRDKTLDNDVRVVVNLDSLQVQTALDTTLQRDAAAPSDPVDHARQELASGSLDDRMAGLRRLDAQRQPGGDRELVQVLLTNDKWQVRKEAARLLGQRTVAPAGAVDALGKSLLFDGYPAVRAQAAMALGGLGDPAASAALQKAAQADADASVQALATAALARLGR